MRECLKEYRHVAEGVKLEGPEQLRQMQAIGQGLVAVAAAE